MTLCSLYMILVCAFGCITIMLYMYIACYVRKWRHFVPGNEGLCWGDRRVRARIGSVLCTPDLHSLGQSKCSDKMKFQVWIGANVIHVLLLLRNIASYRAFCWQHCCCDLGIKRLCYLSLCFRLSGWADPDFDVGIKAACGVIYLQVSGFDHADDQLRIVTETNPSIVMATFPVLLSQVWLASGH